MAPAYLSQLANQYPEIRKWKEVEKDGMQELLTLNTVNSAHQPEKPILPELPPFFLQWGYSIRGVKCSSSSLLRREKG